LALGNRALSSEKSKVQSLPIFMKLTGRSVVLVGEGPAADAKRRLIERSGGIVLAEDADARIAIVAVEDRAMAEAAAKRLKARGILVNVVDRPDLCDFTMPAIIDREPVLVAIGTGGASAGLAKALRIAFEALLPANLGALARTLAEARGPIRARWPDADDRRRAIDTALSPAGLLDPLADNSAENVERWLQDTGGSGHARLETVELRSADPDDLTLRQARWLGQADRIVHERAVPSSILDRARADAVREASDIAPAPPVSGLTLWLRWIG
jgi:uroporphyrin-III C-methyltransferase/precorrin-2 dehydrogenase/sirohydrochlorin ferrochelatase